MLPEIVINAGAGVRQMLGSLPGLDVRDPSRGEAHLFQIPGSLLHDRGQLCAIRTPGLVRRGDQLCKFVEATPQNTQTE